MDHFPGNWGRPLPETRLADAQTFAPAKVSTIYQPKSHTQSPVVTATSVLGVKFKDGVILAADIAAYYGSLLRFRDVDRLLPVGSSTVVGVSGDVSDLQHLQHTLEGLTIREYQFDDGHNLAAENVFEYLSNVMYNRRNKFDPLWNSLVIGGRKNGKSFLGYVDLLGTTYQSSTIATGYGAYIAQPILRKAVEGKEDVLTEEEAKEVLEASLRVLYYRDARSYNKVKFATITDAGVKISEPKVLETLWDFAEKIRGYGA